MSAHQGFAVWITGLPSSGKSSIARELTQELFAREVPVIALESDEMRRILTPAPTYRDEERDSFYRKLVFTGELIARFGVNVIFDATANKRAYRDHARSLIHNFIEVLVDCPLEVCMKRDPKGIYGRAVSGKASSVPGLQTAYEPPLRPELTLYCQTAPRDNAIAIISGLKELRYI